MPIKNLILMGISTGGVALSGVGWEDDIDFQIVVLKDACADPDEEVHGILVDKVTPRQATVTTFHAFLQTLGYSQTIKFESNLICQLFGLPRRRPD